MVNGKSFMCFQLKSVAFTRALHVTFYLWKVVVELKTHNSRRLMLTFSLGVHWDHFMETWRALCDHFANGFLWHIRRLRNFF